MKISLFTLAVVFGLISPNAQAGESWWKTFGELSEGVFSGGYRPDTTKPASKQLEAFLTTTKFSEWQVYEDDLVKLSFPKHPSLKLEVLGGDKGIKVEGGVCTTVDNSYERAYTLRAGNFTYGVFLLQSADWLDDGICLCGPMVHHAYQIKDGCLTRFSLLPGGAVKKAQKLGGKLRLMSFEWTHLACPQEIYEELVERMTLKIRHPKCETELRQEVIARYGLRGKAGFLVPGTSRQVAEALFDTKPKESGGKLVWTELVDDYPCKVEAVFQKNVLLKLTDPVDRTGEPAVKGSLSWIYDRLDGADSGSAVSADPFAPTAPAAPEAPEQKFEFTEDEKEEMIQALIGKAGQSADTWWNCLSLMQSMGRKWKTPARRFTDVILKQGQGEPAELELLEEAKYEALTAWVEEKLHREIKGTNQANKPSFEDTYGDDPRKATSFLDYLCRKAPKRAKAAAEALWATGKKPFALAVIQNLPGLDKAWAENTAKQAIAVAAQKSDPDLMEEVMDILPKLKPANLAPFLQAVDAFKYPEREGVYLPENHWKDRKEQLRKELVGP